LSADSRSQPRPAPEGDAPAWLASLIADAAHMEVPAPLRPNGRGRSAAVLILFGVGPHGPDLLFIERSAGLRKHPGQPAFPGGAVDESDGGPVQAALREAAEETGVEPAGVRVLAVMPELYIWRSDFRVTPVIGWWHTPVPVAPGDPAEIAAFRAAGLIIWGFTAMLLDRVLALGGWEQPWNSGQLTSLPAEDLPAGWPEAGS
jgi:8-oxo-dGTP pyrophosphatase MutT (NUDIX family)